MSRDDGMLYSGLSSPRKVELEKKKAETPKVDPKAEDVSKVIAEMKHDVVSVEHVLFDDSLTEEAKLRRIERIKSDYDLLTKLEQRMKKLLGVSRG